jgi:hypothetical protein
MQSVAMPSDPRDYKLELRSLTPEAAEAAKASAFAARPFVSVLFKCCRVYQRVYRNAEGTRYEGRCPRCGAAVRLRVGEGGTDARFFVAE